MYTGGPNFGLIVEDRLHALIPPPVFDPPIKFKLHRADVLPHFGLDPAQSQEILYYSHRPTFFTISHTKKLTYYDVTSGFLVCFFLNALKLYIILLHMLFYAFSVTL
jgi:hypothetical protein